MRKKLFVIIALSSCILLSYGKDTNVTPYDSLFENISPQDSLLISQVFASSDTTSVLHSIINHINEIAHQTKPSCIGDYYWNDWYAFNLSAVALIISIIVGIGTILGAWWQRKAEKNTRALQQIQKEQQEFILLDLIRHIYRNKVVIATLQWKLTDKFDTHYPSDEHILKLRIPLEELKLDNFAGSSKCFDELHKLKILCRNVNLEIDIAYKHFKMRKNEYLAKDKKSDLDGLEFKCQLLTQKIVELMYNLDLLKDEHWSKEVDRIRNMAEFTSFDSIAKKDSNENRKPQDEYTQKIQALLFSKVQDYNNETISIQSYYDPKEGYRKQEMEYREKDKEYLRRGGYIYYSDILQIDTQLNYDVFVEGKGKYNGEGAIKLIEFQ